MATFTNDPGSDNADAVVTISNTEGNKIVIEGIQWSYSADPIGGNLKVESLGSIIWEVDITVAGPGFIPFPIIEDFRKRIQGGLKGTSDEELVITLVGAGASVRSKVNCQTRVD